MAEPSITINGTPLTVGQAMTVRCAIESLAMNLSPEAEDEGTTARMLEEAYLAHIAEIRNLYMANMRGRLEDVVFPDQEHWEGLGPTPGPVMVLSGSPMAQRLADLERLVLAITKLVPDAPLDTSAGHNIATILEVLKMRHPDV